MNYIDKLATSIGNHCGMSMGTQRERQLLRLYAVVALVLREEGICNEDVHDAWSAWRLDDKPDHPAIVPFDQLTPEVQELDTKFRDAIYKAMVEQGLIEDREDPESKKLEADI